MDAKCINCNNIADYDIDKNIIICKICNTTINYEKYIEMMTEKAQNLADNFQDSWDKRGF